MCLFWTFHINRIIKYAVFCAWLLSLSIMLSRFIPIVAYNNTSFLFIAKRYSLYRYTTNYLAIHQHKDIWFVTILGLVWVRLLGMFVYNFLFACSFHFSWVVKFLGHIITVRPIFWGTNKWFFKTPVPFYIPTSNVWRYQFLHICVNTCYLFFFFLIIAILMGAKWHLTVNWNYISLMTNDVEDFYMWLLYIFFKEMFILILCP